MVENLGPRSEISTTTKDKSYNNDGTEKKHLSFKEKQPSNLNQPILRRNNYERAKKS